MITFLHETRWSSLWLVAKWRNSRTIAFGGSVESSILFDSRGKDVAPEFVDRATTVAKDLHLYERVFYQKFMPSSCFATTRSKWSLFRNVRGETNGDVALCRTMIERDKKCIMPLVARVVDTGMLHDDGWSVYWHGKAGVREVKSTYLTSDELSDPTTQLKRVVNFDGDLGMLFRASVRLEGFDILV